VLSSEEFQGLNAPKIVGRCSAHMSERHHAPSTRGKQGWRIELSILILLNNLLCASLARKQAVVVKKILRLSNLILIYT
jgi:hypothetical protein